MQLRSYQTEALQAIADSQLKGIMRQLVVLPTGCGKTVLFSHLSHTIDNPFPMLVLAHREELLEQARNKIHAGNPDISISLEMAQSHADMSSDVVLASVATLGRKGSKRLTKFDPSYFRTIVIDEAHHAAAESYGIILDYFKDSLQLGFTATPQRGDKVRLSDRFDAVVYHKSLLEMISEGWLCNLRAIRLNTSVDLSKVKIVRGDFSENDLADAVNIDARNQAIVDSYLQYCAENSVKTIVFCVNVEHAFAVEKAFNDRGITCKAVVGSMDSDLRRQALADFDSGDCQVLTNVAVLTEGYDQPDIGCVIMARPTKSAVYFTQAIGRGTRLHPGKESCLIIDIMDAFASGNNRPLSLPSVTGLPVDFDLDGKTITEAHQAIAKIKAEYPSEVYRVRSFEEINAFWEEVDLFHVPEPDPLLLEYTSFTWVQTQEDRWILSLPNVDAAGNAANGSVNITITQNPIGTYDVVLPESTKDFLQESNFDDKTQAFQYADAYVNSCRKNSIALIWANAGWRSDSPTDKQIKYLKRYKIPIREGLTKGQASLILDKLFAQNPKKPVPHWVTKKAK